MVRVDSAAVTLLWKRRLLGYEPYLEPTQVNRLPIAKARRERTLRN